MPEGNFSLLSSLRAGTRGQAIFELVFSILVLSTSIVSAECVPLPNCEEIGYTETSCDGDSLKCPFDTSKLFCLPCDSSYQYTCTGTGYSGGTGLVCGGKYVSCTCSNGYKWNGSICEASCLDSGCSVGNILYSDMTCCKNILSNKTPIGVVVKDNEIIMSQMASSTMDWGTYGTNVSGLTDITSSSAAQTDMNGKSNTAAIIAGDSYNVAAKYCNTYTTSGTSAGDWYLPAVGELYSYVYGNYSKINTTMTNLGWSFGYTWLWSSSEYGYSSAWVVNSDGGYLVLNDKNNDYSVSCFLDIR